MGGVMKNILVRLVGMCVLALATMGPSALGQENKPSGDAAKSQPAPSATSVPAYSGMYTFLKEGEFVQVTVEDEGHVTGFISRFGDGESDQGTFLDQFFKSGKL